jgi:hypothetical protein
MVSTENCNPSGELRWRGEGREGERKEGKK